VTKRELAQYQFPAANVPIVTAIEAMADWYTLSLKLQHYCLRME
jgi:hypothetical protein